MPGSSHHPGSPPCRTCSPSARSRPTLPSTVAPPSARPSGRSPHPCSRSSRSGGRSTFPVGFGTAAGVPATSIHEHLVVDDRAGDNRRHHSTGRVEDVRPRRGVSPQLRRVGAIAGLPVTARAMERDAADRDIGRRPDRRRADRGRRDDHGARTRRPAVVHVLGADEGSRRAARVGQREADRRSGRRIREARRPC